MADRKAVEALYAEREALHHLLAVLKREQLLLVQADVDVLPPLTQEKTKIVMRLIDLAKSRHQAIGDAGFAADEAGMHAWLDENPQPNFRQAWADTLSIARAAREVNRVNGLLIGKHLSRGQQLIDTLKGERGMLYGADGQTTVVPPRHSLTVS
jgi:flagella synthesis protein FlgN